MKNLAEAIIFGFKEILNYHTIKLVLLIGLAVTVLWSVIGYFTIDYLVSISNTFIDLVPFSMIRSNSAWMLASLLWFMVVIITFTLIHIFFGNLILEKVSKDRYSSFSLSMIVLSGIFWGGIWFFNSDVIHAKLLELLDKLPFDIVESTLAYLLSYYFIYNAIIVTMLIVTSFFSESLLKKINKNHFPESELLKENEFETSRNRVVDIAIFSVVSILAFPMLFIPVVNFIIQIILWIWLLKDTFVVDSAAVLIPKDKSEKLLEHKKSFFIISSITALFNFIPLFNLFGPFFGELSMFYYIKRLKEEF